MRFILHYDAGAVNAYHVNDCIWLIIIHVVSIRLRVKQTSQSEQFFFRIINQGPEQDVHTSEAAKYSITIPE